MVYSMCLYIYIYIYAYGPYTNVWPVTDSFLHRILNCKNNNKHSLSGTSV